MAKRKSRAISLRAKDAEEGLLSDADITITEAIWTTWAQADERALVGGREAEDPALKLTLEPDEGDTLEQFLSAGKANRVVPSDDGEDEADEGEFLIPAEGSSARGMSKSCNAFIFLQSAAKPAEGKLKFPEEKYDDGISCLEGLRCHVLRVPQPKRSGLPTEEGERERTVLTVREIYELPGGKKAGRKTSRRKTEEPDDDDTGEDEGGDEVTEKAQGIVVKVLDKHPKGLSTDALVKAAFPFASKAGKDRKDILELIQDEDFLGDDDAPWEYNARRNRITPIEDE
jgi:hypothetical protein